MYFINLINYDNIFYKIFFYIKKFIFIIFKIKIINLRNFIYLLFFLNYIHVLENYKNLLILKYIYNYNCKYIIKNCKKFNYFKKRTKFYIYNIYFTNKFSLNFYNILIIKNLKNNFYKINFFKEKILSFPVKCNFRISSRFDLYRINPITNKIIPHKGIDIAVPVNTPIFSVDNGKVDIFSFNKQSGKYIIINHYNKYITKYIHLNKILVKKNQIIKRGDMIALSGNSGITTGPHLHFEFWLNNEAKDPMLILF